MALISREVPTDYAGGGFGVSATHIAYGASYDLWLDRKETRNLLNHKVPYISTYEQGSAPQLATFRMYPPKRALQIPTR